MCGCFHWLLPSRSCLLRIPDHAFLSFHAPPPTVRCLFHVGIAWMLSISKASLISKIFVSFGRPICCCFYQSCGDIACHLRICAEMSYIYFCICDESSATATTVYLLNLHTCPRFSSRTFDPLDIVRHCRATVGLAAWRSG